MGGCGLPPLVPMQLPLGIALRPGFAFDNYHVAGREETVAVVQRAAAGEGEPYLYLWGERGVGKTHLLQAACRVAALRGEVVAYLPLGELARYSPAVLEGLESLGLVAVDDLEAVAGLAEWEHALFHLYNRMRDEGARLMAAGRVSPLELGLALADLRSRFAWGPVFHVRALDDTGRMAALQLQARQRGLELSDDVAQFLFKRYPRDLTALCQLLDRLDQASLAAQRRLTIPFVKDVLGA